MTLENCAVIASAIHICCMPKFKGIILADPVEYVEEDRRTLWNENILIYASKSLFDKRLENEVAKEMEKMRLPKELLERVSANVLAVGMRMLCWAEYHGGTLDLSREYLIQFLDSSFFTMKGLIDSKKAAEALIRVDNLEIWQKYKLACLYCFKDELPLLLDHINEEEKKKFCEKPDLVKFWSYYLTDKIEEIKGEADVFDYRLKKAVESGITAAVEYCLEGTEGAHVEAAFEAVSCRMRTKTHNENDSIVLRKNRYRDSEESWVPSVWYVDILSLVLKKMKNDELRQFLKEDLKGTKYGLHVEAENACSNVLELFLKWPHQDNFMKMAGLMWTFLPKMNFAILVMKICDNISNRVNGSFYYREERTFDYRKLLKEFWLKSPAPFRKYVLRNEDVNFRVCVALFSKICTFQPFTSEDFEMLKLIVAIASREEEDNILSCEEWRNLCIRQMYQEKWDIMYRLTCFFTDEGIEKFKRNFIFAEETLCFFIELIKKNNWHAVVSFEEWFSLSEKEMNDFKKIMINSEYGRITCMEMISSERMEAVEIFIRWCFTTEAEVEAFKKTLILSDFGLRTCSQLLNALQLDIVSDFINFCLSSEIEIKNFKKKIAYTGGHSFCKKLIPDLVEKISYDGKKIWVEMRSNVLPPKWIEIEKFLTFFFSSEEEINQFKIEVILEKCAKDIYFNLIRSNQWQEAEIFCGWLHLSTDQIKILKKETFFHNTFLAFIRLMLRDKGAGCFAYLGTREEAIELLLRWFLTDRNTVLEFQQKIKDHFCGKVTEELNDTLRNFDSMIEQRLKDLDEWQ